MIFYGLSEVRKENKGMKSMGSIFLPERNLKKVFKGAKSLHL